ncbi:hypothetical protein ABK040_004440 [Willaertia magna]
MKLVGITGGIACGKTTLTTYLKDYQSNEFIVEVIDSDDIAHEALLEGTKPYKTITEYFKKNNIGDIYQEDGKTIDRKKLSSFVFKDRNIRHMINNATHFYIFQSIVKKLVTVYYQSLFRKKQTICFVELPLLFETKIFKYIVSTIVCISTSSDNQLRWLMERNNFSEEEALQRIKAQWPIKEKEKRSDFVISNDKDKESLRLRTFEMIEFCGKNTNPIEFKLILLFGIIVIFSLIFFAILALFL